MDIHYEDLVRNKVGAKSKYIDGREIDIVTDTKLIQAKRSLSAVNNPKSFLRGARKQIRTTLESASKRGMEVEYWFKYGVHPKVRKSLDKKGIKVVTGLGG